MRAVLQGLNFWLVASCSVADHVRGVLGNKCAGQHNLKTVQVREITVCGNKIHIQRMSLCTLKLLRADQ
jgi:hypothetical protein